MSENASTRPPPIEGPDTGHDYDGIRELDNKLPNWWLATLLGAMVFGYGYWLYFHTLRHDTSELAAYEAEMSEAAHEAELEAQEHPLTDDALVALTKTPQAVAAGSAIFHTTCVACHGDKAQGLIGPNLTDAYWLHGGRPTEILHTVTAGVPDKGMPSWLPVLGPERIEQVVAFLLTLRDTNVPGKPPQGELEQPATAPVPAP